ncbi:MAG: hypothetical protein FJ224_05540 [Lentisphaerae bacterium]|nr:hypothetical protein [Lentisphaerota bacterium]
MRNTARVAAAMAGALSVSVQAVLLRELLVVCSGSETVLALQLVWWLVSASAGGIIARRVWGGSPGRARSAVTAVLTLSSVLLPVLVFCARSLRGWTGVPGSELMPFGATALYGFLLTFPVAACLGAFFPLACAMDGEESAGHTVRHLYVAESLGGAGGGVLLTFLLLPFGGTVWTVTVACTGLLAAAAVVAAGRPARAALLAVSVTVLVAVSFSGAAITSAAETVRWRSFGVVGGPGGGRLVEAVESRYQNLALTESAGQFSLYGNGELLAAMPDLPGVEHDIHFIMAQRPDAGSVLLLGGGSVGETRELLKYPLRQVVCVAIDPEAWRMAGVAMPDAAEHVAADGRVRTVSADPMRYLLDCTDRYDVVILRAPWPGTAAANRFYTRSFFSMVRRVLADGGFLHMSVSCSERLQDPAAMIGASVYRTLRSAFDAVVVTAGDPTRFMAGGATAPLTLDAAELAARSRRAGVKGEYFRPEYFLGADEIDPDRVAYTESRFAEFDGPLNTVGMPVTFLHTLRLWGAISGAPAGLSGRGGAGWLATVLVAMFCVVIPARLACRGNAAALRLTRVGIVQFVAVAGGTAMGVEILAVYVLQGLRGFVYGQMALIVALFMGGLCAGAAAAGRAVGRYPALRGRALLLAGFLLAGLALALPVMLRVVDARPSASLAVSVLIHVWVGSVGFLAGACFVSGAACYRSKPGRTAAVLAAADLIGAAAGCMAAGVVLLPSVGVGAAATWLASACGGSWIILLLSRPAGARLQE